MTLTFIKSWLRFRQFYHDHIDPDGIQPRHAVRTTIAGIIAIILYRALDWSQAYWLLLSTVLILQTYVGNTPKQRFTFLISAGLISTAATFVGSLVGTQPWGYGLFLFITTFICLYSYVVSINIGNVAIYINLFCLSAGALPVDINNAWHRTLCVLLATVIAVIVCLCCWPDYLPQQIRAMIAENLKRLAELNYALISRNNHQKAIAIRRNRMMRGIQRAHQLIPSNQIQDHQIIKKIEYLYEIILNFYQLKQYVDQQRILKLIEKELPILSRRLTWLLEGAASSLQHHHPLPAHEKFLQSLHTFEKLYQRHLPQLNQQQFLAFTAYIDNMHKLENTIVDLLLLLQKKNQLR